MLVGFVIMKFLLKFEDEIQDFPEETLKVHQVLENKNGSKLTGKLTI